MLTQAEWTTAYNHLQEQLRRLDLHDLVAEIETAAASRVIEEYQPDQQGPVSRAELSEYSNTTSRARLPSEAWQAAVAVLHAYLIEIPRVAVRVAELLQTDIDQIVFLPDAGEDEMRTSISSFAIADLIVRGGSTERVAREVYTLLELSGMEANARSNIS